MQPATEQPSIETNAKGVLILEDEESIRRVTKMVLEKKGFRVDTAANGRQGLQKLLVNHYDVVVTDYRMAEMDGLMFTQEALKIWPWLKVVMVSGWMDDGVEQRLHRLGVTRILTKPVSMGLLESEVTAAAAESRRDLIALRADDPNRFHLQLRFLRRVTDSALREQSLELAMRELALGLQDLIPFDLLGVLGVEDSSAFLLVRTPNPQPFGCVTAIREEIIERFRALSGESPPMDHLMERVEGPFDVGRSDCTIRQTTSVPVIGQDRVIGMLTIAHTHEFEIPREDVSFLYHVANHLSTILQAVAELRKLAILDPLTGVHNRLFFDMELERLWLLATRYDHSLAVLALDIDHFKEINDTMGHETGDRLLAEFARELKQRIRASDLLVRMGGDEFVLVLPQSNLAEAEELGERIVNGIRNHLFLSEDGGIRITCSVGLAVNMPGTKVFSHKDLLRNADDALYWAKWGGRNRMAVWSPDGAGDARRGQDDGSGEPAVLSAESGRILLADSELEMGDVLLRLLEDAGFVVDHVGRNDAAALLKTRRGFYDLLLAELPHQAEEGLQIFRKAGEADPQLVRLAVCGDITVEKALAALRMGAYEIIRLPCSLHDLRAHLERAMAHRRILLRDHQYRRELEEMVREKSRELALSLEEVKNSYEFSLEAMVHMLDAREFETSSHSQRVTRLTRMLADHMGVQEPELTRIARGALLHDIGKIAIPDAILRKPGPLTEDERAVMQTHPEVGYGFIRSSSFLQTEAEIVLNHHEAWDGSGYPRGLRGEQIPLSARIFSLIDAYDAMRSPRIYKSSMPREAALAEVRAQSGKQFDPRVVERFLELIDELEKTAQWPRDQTAPLPAHTHTGNTP